MTELTPDQWDELAEAADAADAGLHFTLIPVPDAMKVDALKNALTAARNAMVKAVRSAGQAPWEDDHPTWFGEAP